MRTLEIQTQGICPKQIIIKIEGEIIHSVQFVGGCKGNLEAISRLVRGQNARFVIETLKGVTCQDNASCPDSLAKALEEIIEAH